MVSEAVAAGARLGGAPGELGLAGPAGADPREGRVVDARGCEAVEAQQALRLGSTSESFDLGDEARARCLSAASLRELCEDSLLLAKAGDQLTGVGGAEAHVEPSIRVASVRRASGESPA